MARYGHTRDARCACQRRCSTPACISTCTGCRSCSAASSAATARGRRCYPVACSPQAWAAASPFALLQACLGLEVREGGHAIVMHSPRLPPFIDWVRLERIGGPDCHCDLLLQRHENSVGVEVLRKHAGMAVTVIA